MGKSIDEDAKKKRHIRTKNVFKVVGIVCLIAGVAFFVIPSVSLYSSIDDPYDTVFIEMLWMYFLATPLLPVGIVFTTLGFRREMGTYVANETVPVLNEMSFGLRPAVTNVAGTAANALRSDSYLCRKCNAANGTNDRFCGGCGTVLKKTCGKCGAVSDYDNNYCTGCGAFLG